MKRHYPFTLFLTAIALGSSSMIQPVEALPSKTKKSLLDNDPDVIYLNQYVAKPIKFLTVDSANIYASKKGNASRKLGTFKPGSEVTLIAMNATAYRVSGKGKHGKISGWVSPKKLASKDPKFVENLQLLYKRQMLIKQLIANKEVAIGMTIKEVRQSLGDPTKKTSKVTKDGRTGNWEFTVFEEEKHYNYFTDPRTGQPYRKLSHITNEEKSKITVEFINDVVTSVTTMEDNGPDKIRIITPPIIFGF